MIINEMTLPEIKYFAQPATMKLLQCIEIYF